MISFDIFQINIKVRAYNYIDIYFIWFAKYLSGIYKNVLIDKETGTQAGFKGKIYMDYLKRCLEKVFSH